MKRYPAVLIAGVFLSLSLLSSSTNAHILKTDGTIGAVLHIEPDDSATSGRPTTYAFVFTDTSDRFSAEKCNCTVAVQENGQTISTQPLQFTAPLTTTNTYTFAKPDVYTLLVSGEPKDAANFQSFALSYLIRVGAGAGAVATGERPFPLLLWLGMGMGMGLLLLGAYASGHTDSEETKKEK